MFKQKSTQLRRYEKTVESYERQPVETGKILFFGSSGFTNWRLGKYDNRPLEEDIRMKDGSAVFYPERL